jgi:hypothetical protein
MTDLVLCISRLDATCNLPSVNSSVLVNTARTFCSSDLRLFALVLQLLRQLENARFLGHSPSMEACRSDRRSPGDSALSNEPNQ